MLGLTRSSLAVSIGDLPRAGNARARAADDRQRGFPPASTAIDTGVSDGHVVRVATTLLGEGIHEKPSEAAISHPRVAADRSTTKEESAMSPMKKARAEATPQSLIVLRLPFEPEPMARSHESVGPP